jgi:predicted TIM-barrel fold metal-dependent hydrolase
VVPDLGIDVSVAELTRAKDRGFRGVLLTRLPSGNTVLSEEDDPFWAAAEALAMPIHIHSALSRSRADGSSARSAARAAATAGTNALAGSATLGQIGETMAEMIFSGCLDRFPRLQLIGVEVQAGWIPAFVEYWDDRYWRNRVRANINLKLLPSEYFKRNWLVTFIVDYYAVRNRDVVGVDNIMWSTDYPHHGTDWPYSRKVIDQMFFGVPAEDRFKITCGNAMRVYGLSDSLGGTAQ